MTYAPVTLISQDAVLPKDILGLTEKLAARVHDAWAAQKLKEGWTYGDVKDEGKKTTPCLVPYDELPESEKGYDRCTALETIKGLIMLGYQIVPKGQPEI